MSAVGLSFNKAGIGSTLRLRTATCRCAVLFVCGVVRPRGVFMNGGPKAGLRGERREQRDVKNYTPGSVTHSSRRPAIAKIDFEVASPFQAEFLHVLLIA